MFSKYDRIQVKERGHKATIDGVSFNSIHQEWEYYVTWDSSPEKGSICYMATDVGDLWEKVAEIKDAHIFSDPGKGYVNQDPDVLPKGKSFPTDHSNEKPWYPYSVGIDFAYIPKKDCTHKWVEVGFNHTKTVCYYCDAEKS